MDLTLRELQRKAVAGDPEAFLALQRAQNRSGITIITKFGDGHSGGGTKTPYENIWIEAPEDAAVEIFTLRFGRSPYGTTCTCCGPDFNIEEYDGWLQATGYERSCECTMEGYLEKPSQRRFHGSGPYKTLEEFFQDPGIKNLVISFYDFTPEEVMIAMQYMRTNPSYKCQCGKFH